MKLIIQIKKTISSFPISTKFLFLKKAIANAVPVPARIKADGCENQIMIAPTIPKNAIREALKLLNSTLLDIILNSNKPHNTSPEYCLAVEE